MHGLVSLLPDPFYAQVESLWEELARDFGLTGIRVTPYPHFSWQVVEDYDWEQLEAAVKEIAAETAPFTVRTAGLGLFTGERPVLYIPVVKTVALSELHALIWERTADLGHDHLVYYTPKLWMPHISLAYEDLRRDNIGCVMERLAFQRFNWEMTVDNITLICEPTGQIGTLAYRYKFGNCSAQAG